jgi:uncharacterized membrane protein YedE/YeeE
MVLTIDWSQFTPAASLVGGGLIGLSAVMLMAFKGRIAGVSGIVGGLFQLDNAPAEHISWRLSFLSGLLASAWVYSLFAPMPQARIDASYLTLAIAGLLVGFGTRLGSGCTSGHAVCGLGRLSLRSAVATAGFMCTGFISALLFFHVL